ncbi:MAG TPA: chemotaxis protein CheA, partial [Deltaproteobacteria bacterium]|nr:chemotaxis protein CheA [Deltaproteobacteria bacterium]
MGEFDEIIGEFLAESHEGLEQIASDLLILEKAPGDKDVLDRIFRAVHTIKGTCGFLEFKKLESLTHAGENLLNKMRDGSIVAN